MLPPPPRAAVQSRALSSLTPAQQVRKSPPLHVCISLPAAPEVMINFVVVVWSWSWQGSGDPCRLGHASLHTGLTSVRPMWLRAPCSLTSVMRPCCVRCK